MTPPIELRTRSPLGACYRSPLGVFGSGPVESPEVKPGWTVAEANIFVAGVYQTGFQTRDPNGILVSDELLGEASYTANQDVVNNPTKERSGGQHVWQGPGDVHQPNLVRKEYPPGNGLRLELYIDNSGFDLFSTFTIQTEEPVNFIEGEPVLMQVGEPTPTRLPGQFMASVIDKLLTGNEAHINHATCSRALTVAGTGSNYLRINSLGGRTSDTLTIDQFLTWRMVGQTSGVNLPVGQYATQAICETPSGLQTLYRYADGGSSNQVTPDPNVFVHEQYVEILSFSDYQQWAARRFGANTPSYILGEDVLFTEF